MVTNKNSELTMAKKFQSLGVMIDMSRNAVMSIPSLKRYLPLLKKMGYTTVFLYTEDTYEVDGEPYFGYMRGRYSKAEMKELDAFANSIGMEVIPCIQTLAHLNGTLRWGQIPIDCGDILLADDPRTYEVIEHMFTTLAECFTTRKIHVGMDEAHMLGRGKHLDKFGYEHSSTIIARHLEKVCEIAKKFDYEVMLWSDMFFRSWMDDKYYAKKVEKVPQHVIDGVPESVIPVYWDYYHLNEEEYDIMFEMHNQLSKKTWFGGGAWTWSGFMPHNEFSILAMGPALRSCRKNKCKNIFMTMWGDDGSECSKFAILPALFYISEVAKGNDDMNSIKEKFVRFTGGITFDEFMMLDAPNNLLGTGIVKNEEHNYSHPVNPSKYMLYSDYFNDFLDYTVVPGASKTYEQLAVELSRIAKKSRKFGYLFNTAAKLCDALAVKYELGVKTRAAYEAHDLDTLRALAEKDYVEAEKRINTFALTFEKQWFHDNKPCGFDVQDQRLGGIIRRKSACRRRKLDYVNGKLDSIPELEEKLLPYGQKNVPGNFNTSRNYLSTNVVSH